MSDLISDGKTKIWWVPTIAIIAAPTVAELTAGLALEQWVTPDGLTRGVQTAAVDNTSIVSTDNTAMPGRDTYDLGLMFKQQGRTVAPWVTFPKNTSGFLVIREDLDALTAWAAAQKAEVYPCVTGQRQPQQPAPNELQKFMVPFFLSAPAAPNATVAA